MAIKDFLKTNDPVENARWKIEKERSERDMKLAEDTHKRMLEIVKKQIVKASKSDNKESEKDLIDLVDLHAYISKIEPKQLYFLKLNEE